ncbi:uncharacterized protein LOC125228552 [Leguminivora glycinivorella]|nr:uncharacterized protein LOC125228552 [Leguminivora glycinivorella]
MRGPYKVVEVLPSGRYALRLLTGGYGKTTQAAAQHMVPWRGEWCPDTCAALFESEDLEGDETSSSSATAADAETGPTTSGTVAVMDTTPARVEDDTLSGEAV